VLFFLLECSMSSLISLFHLHIKIVSKFLVKVKLKRGKILEGVKGWEMKMCLGINIPK
jgi:hypothetical protein